MHKFSFSDRYTTADVGLELEADSLAELFQAGSEGMYQLILGEGRAAGATGKRDFDLRADTPEQLFIDWLSELLYLFDTDGLIACDYQIAIAADEPGSRLSGSVGWRAFDPVRDVAEHEVKAVTYYKLKIERESGVYRTHVVFDL